MILAEPAFVNNPSLAQLAAECADFEKKALDLIAHRQFSKEFQYAKANVSYVAYQALCRMDPRMAKYAASGVGAQIISMLLKKMGSVATMGPVDESLFDTFWSTSAKPTFVLSSSLTANLMLTDPGKITVDDVAWPFPAFRVVLPSSDCTVNFNGRTETEIVRASVIHVLLWDAISISEKDAVYPGYVENYGARNVTEFTRTLGSLFDRLEQVPASAVQEKIMMIRVYGTDGLSVFKTVPWRPEDTLETWFDSYNTGAAEPAYHSSYDLTPMDVRALQMCQRVSANLALYLSSDDEATKKPVWTPASKSTGRHAKIWNVGQNVKISREVRDAATEVAAGRAATAPVVRHIVRGHFKNQPVGTGRKDRKRIHIKPFWRGPKDGEVRERTYEVK